MHICMYKYIITHRPIPPTQQGKGSAKGIADYLKTADDAKKGLAELSPQQKADVLQVGDLFLMMDGFK